MTLVHPGRSDVRARIYDANGLLHSRPLEPRGSRAIALPAGMLTVRFVENGEIVAERVVELTVGKTSELVYE
ncbi:MAG: hypothetical protein GY711_23745 [bacterium]|nr:hypothetical protein [bacterium]